PAKILPYSGIKPQDNGIIRPIAFRPMNQENSRSIGNLVMAASTSTSVGPTPRQRTSGHPSTSSSSNSTLFPLTNSMSTSKIQVIDDNDYDTVPEFIDNRKNESSDPASDNYSLIYNLQQTATQPTRRTQSGASSAGSSNNGNNHFNGFHVVNATSLTSSNSSSTTTSGLPNSPPHSSGSNSSVKKSGSRHSGLHITPSPSDSGIVDYEV
uniref:Uncharacterized protein n=1 Tax=Panagrolaimus sp. JU765 TaxID=591449 RepID=A0AC34RNZ7_9BILA